MGLPLRSALGRHGAPFAVGAAVIAISFLHFAAPTVSPRWHAVHLAAQQLYYLPIILAAASLGIRGTALTVSAISLVFGAHILVTWSGSRVAQWHQFVEIASYWTAAAVAAFLFERIRRDIAEIRSAHRETALALTMALDLRERYTSMHSQRVRAYALLLANRLGLADRVSRDNLAMGALLHDIGKIGIPDRILQKAGTLDAEESAIMRRHPELGARLLEKIGFLHEAREIVIAHHERFDGSGYPRGLLGSAIPFGARIFSVADAFDAMTTARPYSAARSYDDARAGILRASGTQFDPDVVAAFESIPFLAWAEAAERFGANLTGGPRGTGA